MILRKLFKAPCFLALLGLVLILTACDQLFQDPGKILYRPEVLKISDEAGRPFDKLPILNARQSRKETLLPLNNQGKQVQWGEPLDHYKDLVPFDSQEIPYLGGDNCLNSVFFDLIGIPVSSETPAVYQKEMFYKLLQVHSIGPENYFFLNDHLFLKEQTYPYFLKEGKSIVGKETLTAGADPALDRFYQDRLEFYRKAFQNQIVSYHILCDYPPTELGRVKENLLLHVIEDKETFHFLADKQVHLITRKDRAQRFISEFSFSGKFLRDGLQFWKN